MRYRLLALDLDGTALDPTGALATGVREAVARATGLGLRVVLCTGRRFRTALPLARELGLTGAIVVNNGVVVKDLGSGDTLRHAYLDHERYGQILPLLRELGSPLVYVDRYHERVDMLTDQRGGTHPFQREYLDDNVEFCRRVANLEEFPGDDVIMLSMMADQASLELLRKRASGVLGERVRTHALINKNYRGHILEFLSASSGKWSALRRVAADEEIAPQEIAAIGDDLNDVELLRESGLGIAMGNAADSVKSAADAIVASNAENGAVQAIERVLREC
jgi:Cof subfamily protein (haloacid dehalogenase superfamily)